jgi:putative phage-type endonuclease
MTAVANPPSDPEVRRSGYGGSDVAKVLGLSRFGGPMDVYLEKTGQSAPLIETPVMRWGKLLEDPIAREYALQTGRKVRRVNGTLRHPQFPFLMAHLDRTAHKKGERPRVLEAKTAGQFQAADFGEPGTDEVPDDYLVQVLWYLLLTGYDVADLAVLIAGQKFAIYTIPRDEVLIGEMRAEIVRFHTEHVLPRNPPDLDGSQASSDYLSARFKDTGTVIEMTEEIKLLAMAYESNRLSIKAAEQQKDILANHLRAKLGDAAKAEGDGIRVTWAEVASPARTDWPAVAQAAKVPPEIISEFTSRAAPSRRLTVAIKEQG